MLNRVLLVFSLWLVTMLYSCVGFANTDYASQPIVKDFINKMVAQHNFDRGQLVRLFNEVKIRPKVMQSVKAPLEQKPWYTYQTIFVTDQRIRQGVQFWNKYRDVLIRAEQTYGVPASIIVATIGVETKYGQNTGEYRVIDALANIGFSDSPRAKFFRSELEEFLLLVREQRLNPLDVMGSYAGAIGQPQFMPSSYRNYAVNFSGSGKIDLSHNEVDVIGSVANYYHKHGWTTNQPVAIPASYTGGKYQFNWPRSRSISKSELLEYGLIPDEQFLKSQKFRILELEGYYGNEYWMSFHNFDVIKRYNPSDLYAMAVYQLSYFITSLREKLNNV